MFRVSRRTEPEVVEALNWAVTEAQSQLRGYRAHRLRPKSEHAWSFDAPNGVGVYVEVSAIKVAADTASVVLVGSSSMGLRGGFRRRQLQRTVEVPLDGDAARVPAVLVLVFDDGGHVYAFESLEEAGEYLESFDLPSLTGAYSDRGEIIAMTAGDLFVEFRSTGTYDSEAFTRLLRGSRGPQHLVDDPHLFALQLWWSS